MNALPGDNIVLNKRLYRKGRFLIIVVSVWSGAVLGTVATMSVAPVCAVQAPRTVSHALIEIGRSLCQQWSGLANITRIGAELYTFECAKYATFTELEVRLAKLPNEGCSTDSECEGIK